MVEYQVQNGGLGLDEMITALLNATWKAPETKRHGRVDTITNRTGFADVFISRQCE